MKKIITFFIISIISLFSITPVYAENEINSIDIFTYINKDGSATLYETWDMDITEGTEIYKVFNRMKNKNLRLVTVRENNITLIKKSNWNSKLPRSQKAGYTGLKKTDEGYEICAGISHYGHTKYTMVYRIDNFVNQYKDTQGINYAFLSDMSLPIDKVNVTIQSELGTLSKNNAKIYGYGYEGKVYFENGKIRLVSDGDIDKVQILAKLPGKYEETSNQYASLTFKEVLDDANNEKKMSSMINTLLVIGFALLFIIPICIAYFTGTTKKKKYTFETHRNLDEKSIHPFRDLPFKDIPYFYYLSNYLQILPAEPLSGLLSSYLLKWIKEGIVIFEKGEKTGFIIKKDSYSIDFHKNASFSNTYEDRIYQFFRQASGSNLILETNEFEKYVKQHFNKIENIPDQLSDWIEKQLISNGKIRKETKRYRRFFRKVNETQYIFNAQVEEDIKHVYGFYQFLLDEDNMKEKETIEVHLWDEYLIYASLLGIADRVADQLDMIIPNYKEDYADTYYPALITNHFIYHSVDNYTASQSGSGGFSSFSGGGGGFSGGGGGGVR